MAAEGCWNSRPDCIVILTNHIAIAFPPLTPFRHTQRCASLSILAHFQNGDQQKTSNTDDERVSKFQLQRPSQKNFVTLFRDYFRHAYKLYTSQRQPSTRTGEFTMAAAGRASGPTRAAPGIICVRSHNASRARCVMALTKTFAI